MTDRQARLLAAAFIVAPFIRFTAKNYDGSTIQFARIIDNLDKQLQELDKKQRSH